MDGSQGKPTPILIGLLLLEIWLLPVVHQYLLRAKMDRRVEMDRPRRRKYERLLIVSMALGMLVGLAIWEWCAVGDSLAAKTILLLQPIVTFVSGLVFMVLYDIGVLLSARFL